MEDIFEDEGSACEEFWGEETEGEWDEEREEKEWGRYGHDDFDDYVDTGKQFYVNPRGICEDAPCCGCCGMF